MSRKFIKMWNYLKENCLGTEVLTFDEIYHMTGEHVDSEFIDSKRDGEQYGISVSKIDLKSRTVLFSRNR